MRGGEQGGMQVHTCAQTSSNTHASAKNALSVTWCLPNAFMEDSHPETCLLIAAESGVTQMK